MIEEICKQFNITPEELLIRELQQRIDKALNKIDTMFNNGNEETIIDDLLELDKILRGSEE